MSLLRKQESSISASPLAVERPSVPKALPGEGDLGGTRHLDSCLRKNPGLFSLTQGLRQYRVFLLSGFPLSRE